MKRFVIVGLGHFGSWVTRALQASGHETIAIDVRPDVVDRHAAFVTKGVVGDATQVEILRHAGVEGVDAAIVSTGGDLAASVLATLALKDLGIKDIFVKVASPEAARALELLGVTDTIFPEREAAFRVARTIGSRGIVEYLPLAGGYSIQEVAVPDHWLGKTLRELALPAAHGINVVAVYDVLADELHVAPNPDAPLKDSDIAIVVGRDDKVAEILTRKKA